MGGGGIAVWRLFFRDTLETYVVRFPYFDINADHVLIFMDVMFPNFHDYSSRKMYPATWQE